MSSTRTERVWSNWARTETSTPALEIAPEYIEHVQLAVQRARETGHGVKAIGASHSFTAIGATEGIRLNMHRMRGLVSADQTRGRVTLWAGTHLWELPAILDPLGLALPNMGDIDRQTITGVTQTGTHGTGLKFDGLASFITGMTLITGTGEVLTIDENDRTLLEAAAVGIGALGIIVTVTIQCVPAFLLRAEEAPDSLEHVLDRFETINREVDHFEFYWFPHTTTVRTKKNTRLPLEAGAKPLTRFARWVDEELMNNTMLDAVLRVGRRIPGAIRAINRTIESVSSQRVYTDRSYRVFVTSRRVLFKETEFGVPLESVPHVIRDIGRMIERRRFNISFPIEVRSAAPSSLMLATSFGRETGYIAVHRYYRDDEREYFREIETIMRAYGGRPHWGKMHTHTKDDFRALYPRFSEFLEVRNRLDPDRVFQNDYLARVLGE